MLQPGTSAITGGSGASCDNFQVLCLNDCQPVACPIMLGPQCFEFFTELSRFSFIQRYERAIGGPVVLTKELHDFRWREGIGKAVLASRHLKIRDPVAQPLPHHSLITPQHRSWHARGSDELGKVLNICPTNPSRVQFPM